VDKGIRANTIIFILLLLISSLSSVTVTATPFPVLPQIMTFACYTVDIESANDVPCYSPDTIRIYSGDSIIWKNHLKESHSATCNDWDTGLIKQAKHSSPMVFYSTGTVQYHSKARGSTLKGVVIIQLQSTNAILWWFFGMNDHLIKQDSYYMGDLQLERKPCAEALIQHKSQKFVIAQSFTPSKKITEHSYPTSKR